MTTHKGSYRRARPRAHPEVDNLRSEAQLRDIREVQVAIRDMLDSGNFDWSQDFLEGVAEAIDKTQLITQGQRRGINNIRRARGLDEI